MYKYMSDHPELLMNENADGLKKAQKSRYAYFMESSSIEYYIERNCDVTVIGKPLDEKGYGIAMKKSKCLFCSCIL